MKANTAILIFTLLVSLIHFSLNASVTKEDIDDICKGVGQKNVKVEPTTTIKEYIKSLGIKEENHKFFVDFLIEDKIPSKDSIPKQMYVFLVLIALIPIVLITWLFFWFCCCCSCGVFKQKDEKLCYKIIIFIITVALFAGTAITSISSLAVSSNFVDHLKGLTCSFGKFYYHAEFGEEGDQIPRWVGMDFIANLADRTKEQINNITAGQDEAFKNLDVLANNVETYQNDAQNSLIFSEITVASPKGEGSIKPLYSYQFENREGTYITKIGEDCIENLTIPVGILKEFNNQISNIGSESETITDSLEGISDMAKGFDDSLNQIGDKTFTTIKDYKETANKVLYNFFKVLFGMFIAYSIGLIIILLLFTICRFSVFKVLIHCAWNGLLLFIVLTLVIAILFGLLTEATLQIAPAMGEILTYDFLVNNNKFQIGETPAKLIDTCLNGDGNLAHAMNISFTTTDKINDLYIVIENLTDIKTRIESLEVSEALKTAQEGIRQYQADFSIATNESYNEDDATLNLERLNSYTNSLKGSSQHCGTSDVFVSNIKYCPANFEYKSKNDYSAGNNCLLFEEWSYSDIEIIYSTCEYLSDVLKVFEGIESFTIDNKDKLEKINVKLNNLQNTYEKIKPDMIRIAGNAAELGNNFLQIFKPIMSEEGFNGIFNCNFIKKDLINFMDIIFHEFHSDCAKICGGTFCAGAFAYLGLFFLMISIYRHGNKKSLLKDVEKDKDKETETSTPNVTKQGTNIQMQELEKP